MLTSLQPRVRAGCCSWRPERDHLEAITDEIQDAGGKQRNTCGIAGASLGLGVHFAARKLLDAGAS